MFSKHTLTRARTRRGGVSSFAISLRLVITFIDHEEKKCEELVVYEEEEEEEEEGE